MKISLKLLFFLMAVTFSQSSCDKKKTPENGQFMIVNASPDAGAVAVAIDGSSFGSGAISYPGNTGYQNLPEGSHVVKATSGGSGTTLFEGSLSTIANAKQSLFLYDRTTSLKAFAVVDNVLVPPTGKARVRFFNLSPNSPVIDAGTVNGGVFTALFSSRGFEDNTSAINNSVYQLVDAGTYNFQLRVNGAGIVLVNTPALVFEAGKSYTLFAKGISGDITSPIGLETISNN